MPRANKTYSLDVGVIAALEKRAAEEGEPLSRLIERGARWVVGLPLPEKDEEDVDVKGKAALVLEVLTSLGPGPWSTLQISKAGAGSYNLTLQGLQALARAGKVHLWGRGGYVQATKENGEPLFSDSGEPRMYLSAVGERWDLQSPTERIMEIVAKWKAHGGKPWTFGTFLGSMSSAVREAIERLVLSVDDVGPVLDAVAAEMGEDSVRNWYPPLAPGTPATSERFCNAMQLRERIEAKEAAARAAEAALTSWERAGRDRKIESARLESEKLDRAARMHITSPLALEAAQKSIADFQGGEITSEAKMRLIHECRRLAMGCSPEDRAAIEHALTKAGVIGSYGPPPPRRR